MKIILILIFLFIPFLSFAQEIRITELPEATTAASTDLFVIVYDVAGTPVTSKMTFANAIVYLLSAVSITKSSNDYTFPGTITTTAADGSRGVTIQANTSAWSTCVAGVYGLTVIGTTVKACVNGVLHSLSYSD